jgi:hypothetical protein
VVDVLANDSNPVAGPLRITAISSPGIGAVARDGRAIRFDAPPAFFGQTSFTYTIENTAGGTSTATVRIKVISVNVPPSFAAGADQTVLEDAGPQTVGSWATAISPGPPNESSQNVSFTVSNDNNALFSSQPAVSPDGTLSYTPAANANGSATITLTAHDDGGTANGGTDTSPTQTRTITITPVNDPPTFTAGPDQTIAKNAGPQTVNGWATAISPGPVDEAGQTVTFTVSNDNNGIFVAQPDVAPDGTLTYTVHNGKTGTVTVTVSATDDGGTADGGQDTSTPQTFTITIA